MTTKRADTVEELVELAIRNDDRWTLWDHSEWQYVRPEEGLAYADKVRELRENGVEFFAAEREAGPRPEMVNVWHYQTRPEPTGSVKLKTILSRMGVDGVAERKAERDAAIKAELSKNGRNNVRREMIRLAQRMQTEMGTIYAEGVEMPDGLAEMLTKVISMENEIETEN